MQTKTNILPNILFVFAVAVVPMVFVLVASIGIEVDIELLRVFGV